MADDIQRLISTALAEVDYLEKENNRNLDSKTANAGDENYTKYARDLAEVAFFNGNKQGEAWCASFVAWCFYKTFGKAAALKLLCQPAKDNCGAGCVYLGQYFKSKGQWHTSAPKIGDVIVFYNSAKTRFAHTGLVYNVDSSKVYTIEGNTSGASGVIANGGGVCRKAYSLKNDRIAGYGRPKYGSTSSAAPKVSYTTYTVKKGDSLWKIANKLLGDGRKHTQIQKANGLSDSLIRVGQKLKIPKA